jgi:hypothetical protein
MVLPQFHRAVNQASGDKIKLRMEIKIENHGSSIARVAMSLVINVFKFLWECCCCLPC